MTRFDIITEVKKSRDLDFIVEIEKFNPYHGRDGRFATASGAASFTYKPGQGRMYDNAIAREKERMAALDTAGGNFTPAKTREEASRYAVEQLGFKRADYGTKIDIEAVNHINEQITRVQQKYPEVKGAVEDLDIVNRAHVYAQVVTFRTGNMTLEIGSELYGRGMDSIKKGYQKDVESGFHPTGTSAEAIIWHEYGHVLANISSKKELSARADEVFSYNDWIKRDSYYQDRKNKVQEKEWLRVAAKNLKTTQKEIKQGISGYAEKNAAETFAEAFAEYHCSNSPRKEAVAMVEASGWNR